MRIALAATAAAAVLAVSGQSYAQTNPILAPTAEPAISEAFSGGRLFFEAPSDFSNYTLRVSGPNGYFGQVFSERSVPSLRLADHGTLEDGLYTYEITASTGEIAPRPASDLGLNNGRSAEARPTLGMSQSGSFRVANGQVVVLDPSVTE